MHQARFPQINNHYSGPCYRPRAPFNHQIHNFQRPPPQNYDIEYWCETCDRSFATTDLLIKHKMQHQKCNIDGCQFIAHPKVITKHILMQHASGIYKKIANLNNPEDIKKWREERKKKYPTKLNIDRKEAELKEKIERGEKLGLKHDGHNKKYNPGEKRRKPSYIAIRQNQAQKRHKPNIQNKAPSINNNKRSTQLKKNLDAPIEVNLKKLQPFAGIQDIMKECAEAEIEQIQCNYEINDDDFDADHQANPLNSVPMVCGALSSLMCNYELSDDEIDDSNSKTKLPNFKSDHKIFSEQTKQIDPGTDSIPNFKINDNNDDESGPEEVKILREIETSNIKTEHNIVPKNTNITVRKEKSNNSVVKKQYVKKPKLPSTLLQKLLHREIQQERNIVLQCIRHVVKNNFFDHPMNKE